MSNSNNPDQAQSQSNPSGTIDLVELISACVSLVDEAGESIRKIFKSGKLGTIEKDEQAAAANGAAASSTSASTSASSPPVEFVDPQTLADVESQRIIISNLVRLFGRQLRIIGEEGELERSLEESNNATPLDVNLHRLDSYASSFPKDYRSVPYDSVCVWVDPLDGTKEFTLGFVQYVTVLIGITINNRPVAGIIHAPFVGNGYEKKTDPLRTDQQQSTPVIQESHASSSPSSQSKPSAAGRTVWGCVGVGCHGIEPVAPLSSIPSHRCIVTTSRTHFSPQLQSLIESMHPDSIIRCGGAGSKGLLVLSHESDGWTYPQRGTKRWDTAAIEACIRARGGKLTDAYGDEIEYDPDADSYENTDGVVATLRNHERFLLPRSNKEKSPRNTSSTKDTSQRKDQTNASEGQKANL